MDTTKPEWMQIGQPVKVAEWAGVIVDVATCESGRLMVQVESPKGHYHGHRPEWLEYLPDMPDMIIPVGAEIVAYDARNYAERLERRQASMMALAKLARMTK